MTSDPQVAYAVLSKDELLRRLGEDLIVSPILERSSQIGEGSIDISLGTRFIVSRRSAVGAIDPKILDLTEIRKFQEPVVVPFSRKLILHPRNFVLGCTFEFIVMPKDLCGFVLSRSSYGRAGLLVATATYVHPYWHGCLTLELENLGEIPIVLRPGSTIAQLVVMRASPLSSPPPLKSIPVGPVFSTLHSDPRWKKLESIEPLPPTRGRG
jgi:dCTP deaminase